MTTCLILATGFEDQMRPLTANIPKSMLPVANRPIIGHILDAIVESGEINSILMIIGYKGNTVKGYCGSTFRNCPIRYIVQRKHRGTVEILRSVRKFVIGDFILLTEQCIISPQDILKIIHSPVPSVGYSKDVIKGVYHFDTQIFQTLKTATITSEIPCNLLSPVPIKDYIEVTYPWDLLDANTKKIVGENPVVGEGTKILQPSLIEGNCIIGSNCRIGPFAYIRGSTAIGNNCRIGPYVEVKNSVILSGTKISHLNYVGDSVIGRNCNLGAGTKIANLRNDKSEIRSKGIATERKKLGAIIGDDVKIGINCSINCGTIIKNNVSIAPHLFVTGHIEKDVSN
jgi:UDP-N-acetylglucosamine diphosphorylase / glucose-1-phosphate thymidylyltransferase / UDP-N-acetylgalactosamine diphosphorylase / glucosamine-1-phosphate N-acetyltransferase / galactosamine-1-phosphate N-acetyltransferase